MQSEPSTAEPLGTWEGLLLGVSWKHAHRLLPGIALALSIVLLAERLSIFVGRLTLELQGIDPAGRPSSISSITWGILMGLLLGNLVGVHPLYRPGVEFSAKKLLRLGIILIGIRLSFLDVVELGIWGIPVVALVIAGALCLTIWLSLRIGLSARLGALAAASTAICGVTAAVAVAPSVEADEQEVAYTAANVMLFGMLAMFVYPYLAYFLFGAQSAAAGLFLGAAIHDTSQVMGAALSYKDVFGDELVMKIATITKLTRNVFLAGVVPLLGFYFSRKQGCERKPVSIARLFPLFVLGFLVMAVVRSIGDAGAAGHTLLAFGIWEPAVWEHLTKTLGETVASTALGTAMAAVGLSANLAALRGLGWKPLYLGAASATIVGGIGLLLAALVGPRMHIPVTEAAAATASPPARMVSAAPSIERRPEVPRGSGPPPVTREEPRPPSDSDDNSVGHAKDSCRQAEGLASTDPARKGCPLARIEGQQIRTLEPVTFRRGTPTILPASRPALLAIVHLLQDHPAIKKISIQAYTDERANHRRNVELSRRRARAVTRWLAAHKVARQRLQAEGLGPDDVTTDAPSSSKGPRHHQRVEIQIVEP